MKTEQNNEMSRRSFLKQTVLAGTAICVTHIGESNGSRKSHCR